MPEREACSLTFSGRHGGKLPSFCPSMSNSDKIHGRGWRAESRPSPLAQSKPSPPPPRRYGNPAMSVLSVVLTKADILQRKYQPTWFLFFYYWHQPGLYVALSVMH